MLDVALPRRLSNGYGTELLTAPAGAAACPVWTLPEVPAQQLEASWRQDLAGGHVHAEALPDDLTAGANNSKSHCFYASAHIFCCVMLPLILFRQSRCLGSVMLWQVMVGV